MKNNREKELEAKETEIDEEIEAENEEQEPSNFVEKLQQFIRNNRNAVIVAGLGLVAVIAFLIYFFGEGDAKSQKASLSLSRILPYFNSNDFEKALKGDAQQKVRGEEIIGLESIVDQYSSTEPGKTAAMFAGDALVKLNKPSEAERYYEIALKSKATFVVSGSNAGLGVVREMNGNLKEAAEYYEKASQSAGDDNSKYRYQFYAGLCYEKTGEKQKAEKLYRELLGENQFSEFAGQAKAGLIRLGTIIE